MRPHLALNTSSEKIDYECLQEALLTCCTEEATFLSHRDLAAWQLDKFANPQRLKEMFRSPTDYGAFPDLPVAFLKRKSDKITLLLPFQGQVGISINICKPFWDIDKEFSVRISQPVGSHEGIPVRSGMERAYYALVESSGSWHLELQQLQDNNTWPRKTFETAAETFTQLLRNLNLFVPNIQQD